MNLQGAVGQWLQETRHWNFVGRSAKLKCPNMEAFMADDANAESLQPRCPVIGPACEV